MKKPLDIVSVLPEIDWISNPELREKTIAVWNRMYEEGKWEDIMALPCSTKKTDYPHIVHNRSVVQMAVSCAKIVAELHHAEVDMDHLIAAALLQDVSKLVEYEPDGNGGCALSERGKKFMHAFLAAHVALEVGLPDDVAQVILTHTPDSPVYPQTLIGKILFYVDQLDMAAIKGDHWKKTNVIYR